MDRTYESDGTRFGRLLREVSEDLATARKQRVGIIAPASPKWRQLFKETHPIRRESLRGLVARACHRNDLPNSWGLLQYLGQWHRNRVLVAEE